MTNHLYLIDSSVWIRLLRASPQWLEAASRVEGLVAEGTAATNDLVRVEVLVGSRDETQFVRVNSTFQSLNNLPIRRTTWDSAAQLGFSLRRSGATVPPADLIIAASALEHEATVVHADKHFLTIAQHSPLRVESYSEAAA